MLTEQSVIDQITVLEDGQIQVRRANKVLRDGVVIAKEYHRHVVFPGADLSKEDARVQLVGQVLHTPEVVAVYEVAMAPVEKTK
uniref:Uncharacterized protein n=1 Tax=viral metagenome TaxID=1070528 RepID=A0A6M3L1P3_9ZZZZ